VEAAAAGRDGDRIAAERAVDLEPQRLAFARLELAAGEAGDRDVRGAQREAAVARAADDEPDRVPAAAQLEVEVAEVGLAERAHRAGAQFLAQGDGVGADLGVLGLRGCGHATPSVRPNGGGGGGFREVKASSHKDTKARRGCLPATKRTEGGRRAAASVLDFPPPIGFGRGAGGATRLDRGT